MKFDQHVIHMVAIHQLLHDSIPVSRARAVLLSGHHGRGLQDWSVFPLFLGSVLFIPVLSLLRNPRNSELLSPQAPGLGLTPRLAGQQFGEDERVGLHRHTQVVQPGQAEDHVAVRTLDVLQPQRLHAGVLKYRGE